MHHLMTAQGWAIVVAVGVLAVAGVSSARAQGGGLDETPVHPDVLLNKGVQKELKLSDDQIKEATAIALGFRATFAKGLDTLRREIADEEERARQTRQLVRDLYAATATKLKDVLSDKQVTRLKQIDLRRRGIVAFEAPSVQSALKLTDAQKAELRALWQDARAERPTFRAFLAANPDATPEKWMEVVKAFNDRAMARMLKVLDARQRAQWSEMLGQPFEYKEDGPNQPAG
jgi:hypothetical protein